MANQKPEPPDVIEIDESEIDNPAEPAPKPKSKLPAAHHWKRFKDWYLGRKKWTLPASALLIILVLAGIPFTRYNIVSLVHKRDLEVRVVDATTNTPVSGAVVSLGPAIGETSAYGTIVLHHVGVGNQKVAVNKKYYQSSAQTVLSPIFRQRTVPTIKLKATGRQVKISVANLITKKSLANVDIKIADITAKTDQSGSAIVVVPAGVSQEQAALSLDGYNGASVIVKVSNNQIQNNLFSLTPAGKVYFLSKLSGKIDVVKTNLDGTERQTVLAGTGSEDDQNTVLLASKDWKYLALLSRRAGNIASLYLINTSDDSLTTIDSRNASFTPVGWSGHYFVYKSYNNDVLLWKPGQETLKSYDADNNQTLQLDATNATGTSFYDSVHEYYGYVYLLDSTVLYSKEWEANYYLTSVDGEQGGVYSIDVNGKNHQTLKTFNYKAGAASYIGSVLYSPNAIYFQLFEEGGNDQYLVYSNGKLNPSNITDDTYSTYLNEQKTYLDSPNGNQTFWSEPRDGKNTLLIGDDSGQAGKTIANLSDYSPYGWYTDNYLLVSKNASELYIMPNDGSQVPVKISDYHKPAVSFNGYGGGYGGL